MTKMGLKPQRQQKAFRCPRCGHNSDQLWKRVSSDDGITLGDSSKPQGSADSRHYIYTFRTSTCGSCERKSIRCAKHYDWKTTAETGFLIFPRDTAVDDPNEDMSEDVKLDYREAALILNDSPRGACALLRLALQKLLNELGENGKDLNGAIKNLVEKGLDPIVQKALDSVRITGNEAVHPEQLDLRGDVETAETLFFMINFIAETQISHKKKIAEFYDSKLPENKRGFIEDRDKKQPKAEKKEKA